MTRFHGQFCRTPLPLINVGLIKGGRRGSPAHGLEFLNWLSVFGIEISVNIEPCIVDLTTA